MELSAREMKLRGKRSILYLCFYLFKSLHFHMPTGQLARATAGVFVEEPQNATVVESSSATFRCSVSNSSFSIFWHVNNSDAKYTIFQERGVTIVPINDTSSQLIIVGYKKNNNTLVNCAALKYQNYRLVDWIPSESALLVVIAAAGSTDELFPSTQDQLFSPSPSPISHITSCTTILPLPCSSRVPPSESEAKWKEQHTLVLGASVAAAVLLFVAITMLLVVNRARLKKWGGNLKTPEKSGDNIKLQSNALYEFRRPVPCERNPAYDNVVLRDK